MSGLTARQQVRYQLDRVYRSLSSSERDRLADRVLAAAGVSGDVVPAASSLPDSDEVVLITYGDTFISDHQPHLRSLATFWQSHLSDAFTTAHVLPFFPSSSDGGFAVVDYRAVSPSLGDWHDLGAMGESGRLMFDLVCNHGSAQSAWFQQFLEDEVPGRNYYLTADPDADLSLVTRPRTHPLLVGVDTAAGKKHVWATFSHDQVDFDFANPDVLVEFCEILGFYLRQGASRIRLDAIAYLWKELGTSCIHLEETHRIVKLMRVLVSAADPDALLITETNVPHAENTSYFGDGDEAQVVYNFTLAPLLVWSAMAGRADALTNWLGRLAAPPAGCTFLNFIASHDGIGLRPIEDLVDGDDVQWLVEQAQAVGGDFSPYSAPGGPRPYELNVSLSDLLAGPTGETAARFLVAHAAMLAVQGIPAIYVHSVLSTPGDTGAVRSTGHKRDINRSQVALEEAEHTVTEGWRARVFADLVRLIRVRRSHSAFDPESAQVVHVVDDRVVAIERASQDEVIFAVHNMSGEQVPIEVPDRIGLHDLLTEAEVERNFVLEPWQAVWLSSGDVI